MKKVFDQTFRDIKREVNKKVLKVPGIEQKVLDATSNEPWGPHGTLLADIAQATRNYHEYQMIMAVIWKRINDTGKNWRHVYKALTVLDYLVAHGSERVIDDIREHSYQISTLSDFQYIDSSGRDQGSNVRKKSQSLVALVNDKERIIEVRQKAAANRDKFRNTSAGGMYRPGSYSSSGGYGDRYDYDRYEGRYGNKDDDQNGYGREREYGYRDDDRYGRNGDSYGRDGDRYGRDYEDRYGRDPYRDDDYRGRSRSVDGYQDGSSRNSDRNQALDDENQQVTRQMERKFSEQNIGAPPTYEEVVSESRSPVHSERDGEGSASAAPRSSSPPAPRVSSPPAPRVSSPLAPPGTSSSPAAPGVSSPAAPGSSSPPSNQHPIQATNSFGNSTSVKQEVVASDEFDPRGSLPASAAASNNAAPTNLNGPEMDLLGSLSDSFSSNSLAIMPAEPATSTVEADGFANSGSASTFNATQSGSNVMNQTFEDPFGDSPFKAIPSTDTAPVQQQISASTAPFQPNLNQNAEIPQPATPNTESVPNFGDSFYGITYSSQNVSNVQPSPTNSQFLPQELSTSQPETDILADILPPSGPSPAVASPAAFSSPTGQPAQPSANMYGSFHPQVGSMNPAVAQMPSGSAAQHSSGNFISQGSSPASVASSSLSFSSPTGQPAQPSANMYGSFHQQMGSTNPVASNIMPQMPSGSAAQHNNGNFISQGSGVPSASHAAYQNPSGPATQQSNELRSNLLPQAAPNTPTASQPAVSSSTGSLAIVPQSQPTKDKFEPKSAVWADTLSRGLVNLNISGPKTNPLADIGVDFDAINRKEKRMEKQPPQTAVTSTVTMGKAMGSGTGLGRAGAGAIRAPPNHMMGSNMGMGGGPGPGMGMGGGPGPGMGMGMGGGPGPGMGMGMGGYGGMNQPMGMGMGMGMGMNPGMNMGMGQGVQMQPQTGMMPPGSGMPGGYRPMMGASGYTPQQPYGGGYR
ncbi:clathrin interactor EPSIN 2-like [Melia azedarach]|uniref:Clathrin interactor EPSIN 2-like n=1 Tax=Melia azedarach TaxID=155640 RepID=A0ACC1YI19_MELAZ|nr:clathrin interactor EPSIN 2-like [Melia azedarach]